MKELTEEEKNRAVNQIYRDLGIDDIYKPEKDLDEKFNDAFFDGVLLTDKDKVVEKLKGKDVVDYDTFHSNMVDFFGGENEFTKEMKQQAEKRTEVKKTLGEMR